MKWEDLSPHQQHTYGNGCGPDGNHCFLRLLSDLIPDGRYGIICRWHDFHYDVGGTEFDRWRVEWEFAKKIWKASPWFLKITAPVYATQTFLFGWFSWNYKGEEDGR